MIGQYFQALSKGKNGHSALKHRLICAFFNAASVRNFVRSNGWKWECLKISAAGSAEAQAVVKGRSSVLHTWVPGVATCASRSLVSASLACPAAWH